MEKIKDVFAVLVENNQIEGAASATRKFESAVATIDEDYSQAIVIIERIFRE
jgi:hypothetical protein